MLIFSDMKWTTTGERHRETHLNIIISHNFLSTKMCFFTLLSHLANIIILFYTILKCQLKFPIVLRIRIQGENIKQKLPKIMFFSPTPIWTVVKREVIKNSSLSLNGLTSFSIKIQRKEDIIRNIKISIS